MVSLLHHFPLLMIVQRPHPHSLLSYFAPFKHSLHCSSIHYSNALYTGVKSYDVSLDTQTALITTEESLDYETVLEKIKKTGKKVNSGEADGKEMSI